MLLVRIDVVSASGRRESRHHLLLLAAKQLPAYDQSEREGV